MGIGDSRTDHNTPALPPPTKLAVPAIRPPNEAYPVKTDDRGRIKLPPPVVEYLRKLGDEKVYITTFDEISVRLYPLSKVPEVQQWIQEKYSAADAEAIWRMSTHWGKESDIDSQDRVSLPMELRQHFQFVNTQIHLVPHLSGRYDVLNQKQYDEKMALSREAVRKVDFTQLP